MADERFADDVRAAPADQWVGLRDARAAFVVPGYVTHPPATGADGVVTVGWDELADRTVALVRELAALGAVTPAVPWMAWAPDHYEATVAALDTAGLDDVVAVITTIVRSDRFSGGALAAALDSGVLLAAVDRLLELGPTG